MKNFDDVFDAAPSAEEFDALFDKAEAPKKSGALQRALQGTKDIVGSLKEDVADPLVQMGLDFALGTAQGMTLGFADELAAVAGVALDPLISKLSGESAIDDQLRRQGFQVESPKTTYTDELERSRREFKRAEEESPWLYGAGYLGGAIPSGQALGGALSLATKGTKLGQLAQASKAGRIGKMAVEGALGMGIESIGASEGTLLGTPEQKEQVSEDILSGVGTGAAVGAGLGTLGQVVVPAVRKGLEPIAESIAGFVEKRPFLRQLVKSKEYGEAGINPVAEKELLETSLGKKSLSTIDTERSQELMNEILSADKTLGREVSRSLEDATKKGVVVDAYPVLEKSMKSLNMAYDIVEEMGENPRGRYILSKIADSTDKTLSPTQAKELLDDVDAFISKFGRIAPGTETSIEGAISRNLKSFRSNLSNKLKEVIPEYKTATDRFSQFRQLVPESIIAGDLPRDVADVYMGDLRNPQKQLLTKLRTIVKGSTQSGSSSAPIKEAYVNAIRGIRKFEEAEAARGLKSPLKRSADEYAKIIKDYADDAAVRRQMANVEEMSSIQKNVPAILMDTGSTVRSKLLTSANIYGRAKKSTSDLSKKLFTAPREQLDSLANRLTETPGLEMLGRALKEGVESNDSFKRNAALFSIMQNPSAKLLIGGDDDMGD
jgi:ElaB/YqjD/DUF883 family membrane-anchored ribosome-binding protein